MQVMLNKVKNSTILVTGGAGFIGSYVIEELIPLQPKKIIIIDNFHPGQPGEYEIVYQ
jgi:UDP-glucose 4-epimerase